MDKKDFETKEQLELDAAEKALENVKQEEIAAVEAATPTISAEENARIKQDRMRFITNSLSSTLAILGILLNVFYFVSVYKNNAGYFRSYEIGVSVLVNLIFMLAVFLCSQGVKNYNKKHSIALIVIGAIELVRIAFMPTSAFKAGAVDSFQYARLIVYLAIAAALLIASGIIGVIRSVKLTNYKKSLEVKKA